MKNPKVKWLVYTALMCALAVVAQNLRALPFLAPSQPLSTYVIGSLVNACLIIAACVVGWKGGLVVSCVTPVVALLQGHLPFALLMPLVAAGNFIYVLLFWLAAEKIKKPWAKWAGGIAASLVKTAFLYLTIAKLFVAFGVPQGAPAGKVLAVNFSYPQLVTAVIGLAVALSVTALLKKARPGMEIL
ncbi:MAG: ECF transporter S component [Eubacteriales bacterium]|nr:ECF transporter S component [Eubacteriales bacterium]